MPCVIPKICGTFFILAPKIIGIDRRNEKRTATCLFKPVAKPAIIVIPEREVPGIKAIA